MSSHASHRPWRAPGIAWFYFAVLFFLLCFAAFLWKSGERLVREDSVGHVHWAIMLGGESNNMARSKAALLLFQEGRYDSLLLSGPLMFGTHYESEFSQEWLLSKGFPKDRIFQFHHDANSTQTEGAAFIPQLRLLGIDTVLLITSNYHTARAGRIFDRLGGGNPVIKTYPADDPDFDPKAWWAERESRRIWFIEWLKTLHTGWELLGQKPMTGVSDAILIEPNPRLTPSSPSPALDSAMKVSAPMDTVKDGTAIKTPPADTTRGSASPAVVPKPRSEKSKPPAKHRKRH